MCGGGTPSSNLPTAVCCSRSVSATRRLWAHPALGAHPQHGTMVFQLLCSLPPQLSNLIRAFMCAFRCISNCQCSLPLSPMPDNSFSTQAGLNGNGRPASFHFRSKTRTKRESHRADGRRQGGQKRGADKRLERQEADATRSRVERPSERAYFRSKIAKRETLNVSLSRAAIASVETERAPPSAAQRTPGFTCTRSTLLVSSYTRVKLQGVRTIRSQDLILPPAQSFSIHRSWYLLALSSGRGRTAICNSGRYYLFVCWPYVDLQIRGCSTKPIGIPIKLVCSPSRPVERKSFYLLRS